MAVKVIPKKSFKGSDLTRLVKEAEILAKLSHKHIVKFHRVLQTDTKVLIEMEVVGGGQLLKLMPTLSESSRHTIMRCIYSALEYIHKNNIVHRDLKPGVV